jgi:hypothetical protein
LFVTVLSAVWPLLHMDQLSALCWPPGHRIDSM